MPESVSQLTARDLMTSRFVQVDTTDSLSSAFAALKKGDMSEAVVLNGKKFAGLLTESGLLRNVDVTKTKVSTVLRTSPSLSSTDSFDKVVRLMRDADVRVLPVLEKGKLVGVVTASEVIARLRSNDRIVSLNAKSLATFHPVVISDSANLGKAIQQMKDARVKKLPVVDNKQKPVGVLRVEEMATDILLNMDRSARDSFKMGRGQQSISKSPMSGLSIKSVMDENVPIISSSEKGTKVVQLLSGQRNPVVLVSNGTSPGLISVQSILDAYLQGPVSQSTTVVSPVQVSHLPDLDEIDRAFVMGLLDRTYGKVERTLKGQHSMHVVFKQSKKAGLRVQTDVHIAVQGAGRTFNAQAKEWKVRLAVKAACKALEAEVEKAYKSGKSREMRR